MRLEERRERGWEDAWPSCPSTRWGETRGGLKHCFSLLCLVWWPGSCCLALCCSAVWLEGRGAETLLRREGRMEQATRVPSWSFAVPVLPKLPPAECDFAIYLHVIIAMRCRY